MYSEVEDYIDDVNRGPKSAQYKYFSLAQYLSWVISIVNNRGYFVSRSKASYEQRATYDIAQDLMFPIWGKMSAREKDYRESIEPGEKEIETAHRAIEWAESLIDNNEDVNDYLYNISSIAKLKAIDFNLIGYAASIYPAYNKAMEKKEESKISNYVGTIGKRENFTVTLEKVLTFENHYGLIYFYLFKDLTGNKLVWKTNTGINDLEINIPVAVKATIKKHEIKYDCKQTVINRVVLI